MAHAHVDGPSHVWVALGPDDDIRAEPLARRAHALLQQVLAGESVTGPSEPASDVGVWVIRADTRRAAEAQEKLRAFLASEGCALRPEPPRDPWLEVWG